MKTSALDEREIIMVGLMIRRLVKNSENTSDPEVRRSYGTICALSGIVINALLFLGKLLAGVISGSIAITADAFNNLSDASSSILTLVGFRLAAQAPDKDHPFGHGRFEYISGMLVSAAILLMGAELFRSGVIKIFNPAPVEAGHFVIIILAASVLLKLYMAFYNKKYGEKISSPSMRATAVDSISDCIATGAVLLATVLSSFTAFNVDGWAGAVVAVMIIFAGIGSLKDTVNPLLGQAPDEKLVREIYAIVNSYPETMGVHDLMVHDYGPGRLNISLHIEADGGKTLFEIHDVIDAMEREIGEKLHCGAVIHMDPVCPNSQQSNTMRGEVTRIVKEKADERITVHDLRIIPCNGRNKLIFDSVIPGELSTQAKALKKKIEEAVSSAFPGCEVETTIDFEVK